MFKLKFVLVTLFIILFATSCSNHSVPEYRYKIELSTTDFNELVEKLVDKASNQVFPNMQVDDVLLVSNFVQNYTLKGDTKLCFVLTENLKNVLVSKYNYTIREIELSNRFRLGKEGFKVLTRDASSIDGNTRRSRYVATGSYTITKNQLILFFKLIDIKKGLVLASSTIRVVLTQEIIELHNSKVSTSDSKIYQPFVL
jgi:PBP1b-binding outer membrane lipoprotein LpoB